METYDSLPFASNNSLLANSDPILTTAAGSGGLLFGGINNDILTPTNFNLVFTGAGADTVEAATDSGDNRIYTGSDGDLLNAGNNDRLLGGAGNDTLDAGNGENNRLYAGAGNDRLLAGNGGNFLVGGVGNDEFWLAENTLPQARNTIVDFEDEIDRLVIADVAEVTNFADLTLSDTEDGVVIQVGEDEIALLLGINSSNLTSSDFRFSAAIPSSLPVEISPTNGEEMVNLTRETVVNFPEKINPTSVNSESFYLIANGTRIEGNIVVSSTEKFATFFYDEALPASTEVRVVVDGDKILNESGIAVDADGDGNAGGLVTADFTTLPLTRIEGTNVFGFVYDSYNKDENGDNIPVVGATIRVDAFPEANAVTDENGFFKLENVPAPEFAVHIDGATATNAPEGTVYATVGKLFHSVPGQEIQLTMDGEPFDIYLPPMATEDIQDLSPTEDTEVGFGAAGKAQLEDILPDIDPEAWELTKVIFPAGSAQDEEGNAATKATIIPVAPDRLPAPLPGGVDPKLVISIQAGREGGFSQAGGATNFDVPAPVQFPNLDGLAPGEKATIWSFNHDAGRWDAIGLGTVSEDGKVITSDPGVGILAPGWHFTSPPLNWTGSGGRPQGNDPSPTPDPEPEVFQSLNSSAGGNELSFTFTPPTDGKPPQPGQHELPRGEITPTRQITITVEGPLNDYYKPSQGGGIRSGSWTLRTGDAPLNLASIQKNLNELKTDLNGGKIFEENILYGSKIEVKEVLTLADGSTQKSTRVIFPYMLIDATDPTKEDLKLQFAQTINDGAAKEKRELPLKIRASGSSKPNLSLTDTAHYFLANSLEEAWFDPTAEGNSLTSAIQVKNPLNDALAGNINLEGKAVKIQGWRFDAASFETIAKAIGEDDGTKFPTIPASDRALMDTQAERDAILASIATQTAALFQNAGLNPGIFQAGSAGGNVLNVSFVEGANPAPGNGWNLGGAIGALGAADVDLAKIVDVYNNRNNYSQLERAYRAGQEINNQLGGNIEFYFDNFFEIQIGLDTTGEMQIAFGHNNAHEIGHHLGLFHTGSSSVIRLAGGGDDVMRQGLYLTDTQKFNLTKEAAKMGLHISWTGAEADKAIAYYAAYQAAGGNFNEGEGNISDGDDGNIGPGLDLFPDPLLGLFSEDGRIVANTFDLGTVVADGEGGESISTFWSLFNLGPGDLTLTDVSFSEDDAAIELSPDLSGTVLNSTNGGQLDFLFDPTEAGEYKRNITIIADNGEELTIEVTATAIDPDPVLEVSFLEDNNNFGGLALGSSETEEQFITVTNSGLADLTFTPTILNGNLEFNLGDFANVEQTLAFGESLTIPVTFKATSIGLQPGTIQFSSNDPDRETFDRGIVGTGIPSGQIDFDWGNDFVVVEYNDFVQRATSNDIGDFMFEIPTFTEYEISIFDPISGLIATGRGFTGPAAAFTDLTSSLAFQPSIANDTDADGLPDDIEFAIGTALNKGDTDNDGLSDFAEIEQGIDPLGGQNFPTGIIASLPLEGEAKAIVVEGSSSNSTNQLAYIATGSYGLAIVNVSEFNNPNILGQLDLPGDATDVAVDTNLGVAVIATNSGGLQFVDVSDPMQPTLMQTLTLDASQLEIAEGIVYATVGNSLRAIDLVNAGELQNLALPGNEFDIVTDLTRDGTNLYAFSSGSDVFSIIDIASEGAAVVLGNVVVDVASSDVGVFAANGVAYLAGSGLRSVDISDPTNPTLISDAQTFFTARDTTLNGSGLGLVAAEDQGLGVYNISDPEDTDAIVVQIDTPGLVEDVAIASGIAYVADSSSGLQVINYLAFDNLGQAPTVSINTAGIDEDPDVEGIQVVEGSTISLFANVLDDVQVRNVELLVNGQTIRNDISFPFDLRVITPNITPESNTIDIQVKATDTGGNSTLSDVITINLVEDTFAPEVSSTNPSEGIRRRNIPEIAIRFDESIDSGSIDLTAITLKNLGEDGVVGGGDDTAFTFSEFQLRNFDRTLVLLPPEEELTPGNYQLTLGIKSIADRAGNFLTEPFTLQFTKRAESVGINLEEIIEDSIVEQGEDQIFTFSATAGDRIYYDGLSGDAGLRTRLLSPSGLELFNNSTNSDSFTPTSLIETGTYQIVVDSGFSSATGDFSFRVLDLAASETIELDTSINGTLDEGIETDIYQFAGTKGQRLFFDDADDQFNFDWTLYSPANKVVQNSFFSGDFEATLPGDGIYVLVLNNSFDTNDIDYSFTVVTPETTTTELVLGEIVTGNIGEPGEENIYTFSGEAGQKLYFDGLSANFNLTAQLLSPTGVSLFSTSTGSDGTPISLTETGTYQLIVNPFSSITEDYSFRLLDLGTAEELVLDETVEDILDPGNGTKIYQIAGTEGQKLFFDSLTSSNNLSWTFYGPGTQFIQTAFFGNDFEATLAGDGTYTLVANGSLSSGTVNYSFVAVTPEITTTELILGEIITDNISEPGEEDIYTFNAEAGQKLYFDGLSADFNLNAQLLSPTGVSLANVSTGNNSNPITLAETGTYQLIINPFGGTTADYSFRLLDIGAAEELTLDTSIDKVLDPGNATDIYQFTGSAGQKLLFDSLNNNGNISWTLYDPSDRSLTSASFGGDLEVALSGDGIYTLVINGFLTSGTLDYNFQVTDISDTPVDVTGFGVVETGTIEAGQEKTFTFTAPAGLRVYFDNLDDNDFDPLSFELRDSEDNLISLPIDQDFVLSRSDTYSLTITGFNETSTGDYNFQFLDLESNSSELTLNETVSDTLAAQTSQIYRFNGTAGQKLYFDGLNSDFNSIQAKLISPSGASLFNANLSSDSTLVNLIESGTYFLVISSNQTEATDFSFRLLDPGELPPLELDTIVDGVLENSSETDVYQFTGTKGQKLFFNDLNDDFNVSASLYSPGNQFINSGSDFEATVPGDGVYTLLLNNFFSSETVNYSFELVTPETTTEELILGETVTGNIGEPGEEDIYTFSAEAGQKLYFDGLSADFNLNAELFSPGGVSLFNTSTGSDGTPISLIETGTYQLIINPFGVTTADYSFRLLDINLAEEITLGESFEGVLDPVKESDIYRITGTAGQKLFFDDLDDEFNVNATLYSPGNQVVSTSFFGANFEATLPGDGVYTLILNNTFSAEESINYNFLVVDRETTTKELILGETITGDIVQPGEEDIYTFSAEAGQRIYLDNLTNDFNITAELLSPTGESVFFNSFETLPVTLIETGEYQLIINSFSGTTGDYSFRLLDTSTVPTITLNETIERTLEPGFETDVYQFNGTAEQKLFFDDLGSDFFGATWLIYGPGNQLITSGSLGLDFEATLPGNGTYLIVLQGLNSLDLVNYKVRIQRFS